MGFDVDAISSRSAAVLGCDGLLLILSSKTPLCEGGDGCHCCCEDGNVHPYYCLEGSY